MKTVVVLLFVCILFLAAHGHLRGALKDALARTSTQVNIETPQSIAVEVNGGHNEAGIIAKKCGLVDRGKVGNLNGVYHFELYPPAKLDVAIECLKLHPLVIRVDLQTRRHMVPKDN